MNFALERIEKITFAMELKSFGKKRVRIWYNDAEFTVVDTLSLLVMIAMFLLFVYIKRKIWKDFNYNLF